MRRAAWSIGAVVLAGAMVFEMVMHGGVTIWTGVAGVILPDLAFFVGAGQPHEHGRVPRRTVPVYNLVHRVWLPLTILVLVSLNGQTNDEAALYFVFAVGWLLHIAADRAFGFGLRASDGAIR